jgi:hypothetical protein
MARLGLVDGVFSEHTWTDIGKALGTSVQILLKENGLIELTRKHPSYRHRPDGQDLHLYPSLSEGSVVHQVVISSGKDCIQDDLPRR